MIFVFGTVLSVFILCDVRLAIENEEALLQKSISNSSWMDAWSGWNSVLAMIIDGAGGVNPYYIRSYDENLYDFPHTVNFLYVESGLYDV